ncbi:ISL3 family transposase [Companilactobacillus insicii]|uniref:ISL3 family transposase n=1 Tax=Companilactobacillus insicii TaxID=1732567 RepID=UPI000F78568E|nr:ISL3 family transposase [Companilactobacillus insicii]
MNKYHSLNINDFLLGRNYIIYDFKELNRKLYIYIKSRSHGCACPKCGTVSHTFSSTYHRILQDTPIHNKQTYLDIDCYKYRCLNSNCPQNIFVERLPFAGSYQVRTHVLNTFIVGCSIFLSNESTSRILKMLGVSVSNDSIQRLCDQLKFSDDPNVKDIGIDDIAIKKGNNYATAIYRMDNHQMITLLEGREAQSVKDWLNCHKKIRLVARDREGAYAAAVNQELPQSVQVADRFHLLQNLISHLNDILKSKLPPIVFIQHGKIIEKPPQRKRVQGLCSPELLDHLYYDNTPLTDDKGNKILFDNKRHDLNSKQYKDQAIRRREKQKKIEYIQSNYKMTSKSIAKAASDFDLNKVTVKKYMKMSVPEIQNLNTPQNYKKRKSFMNDYLNIIFKMMCDGLTNQVIYSYIVTHGYTGDKKQLHKYIRYISEDNFPNRPSNRVNPSPKKTSIMLVKRHRLIKFLLSVNKDMNVNKDLIQNLSIMEQAYPIIKIASSMFSEFRSILMGRNPYKLDDFLKKYGNSIISNFCNRIKKDIAPVKSAISLNISSGFVEGNNNKLKLIKRIVYGRSGIVNFREKCLLAFAASQDDFNLQKFNQNWITNPV